MIIVIDNDNELHKKNIQTYYSWFGQEVKKRDCMVFALCYGKEVESHEIKDLKGLKLDIVSVADGKHLKQSFTNFIQQPV